MQSLDILDPRSFYATCVKNIENSKKKISWLDANSDFNTTPNNRLVEKKITVNKVDDERICSLWWYKKMKVLFDIGRESKIVKNIIVHGSFGDFTYCNYSDLDSTIYLADCVIDDGKDRKALQTWLRAYNKLVYEIDPLQHHGPFYVWDSMLRRYSEYILPVDVYKYSWGFDNLELNMLVDNSLLPEHPITKQLCNHIKYANKVTFKYGYDLFSIKRYLSHWMLIPSFYYADNNNHMCKANSFAKFYSEFPELAQPIQIASQLRDSWKEVPSSIRHALYFVNGNRYLRRMALTLYRESRYKNIIEKELQPMIFEVEKVLNI